MNRKYPQVRNINFRDDTDRWLWSDLYQQWLAIAEIDRRSLQCRTSMPDLTKSESR